MLYVIHFGPVEYNGVMFDAFHFSVSIYRVKEKDKSVFKAVRNTVKYGSIVYGSFKDLIVSK